MSDPFVGEIRMFGGNFAPLGWEFCEGQVLPIAEYDVLFSLIGNTYGGNADQGTFALPDLRGRVPLHQGGGFPLGQPGGVETVTLTTAQMPTHTHKQTMATATQATDTSPLNNVLAATGSAFDGYQSSGPNAPMADASVTTVGNGDAHTNFQPYLCVNFIIATTGIFPPRP